jgi:hypothetical protein
VTVDRRSPRSGPSAVNLGDFLSPAWQIVEAHKLGAAGRRRRKFAPGGHGARHLREIRSSGPRSAGGLEPATVVFPVGKSSRRWCRCSRRSGWCRRRRRWRFLILRLARRRALGRTRWGRARVLRAGSP